ncbi:histidine kinase [Microbacterium sp. GXF7504]
MNATRGRRSPVSGPRTTAPMPPAGMAVMLASALLAGVGLLAAAFTTEMTPPVIRAALTAAIYAPVSVFALTRRRLVMAGILAALAIVNGALTIAVTVWTESEDNALRLTALIVIHLSRLPELAALSIVTWLIGPPGRGRSVGIGFGWCAVVLSAVLSAARIAGPVPLLLDVLPLVLALCSFIAAAVWLRIRWADGVARERVAWRAIATGLFCMVVAYGLLEAPSPFLADVVGVALFVLAQTLLPVGILLALGHPTPGRRVLRLVSAGQTLAVAVIGYVLVRGIGDTAGLAPEWAGAMGAGVFALLLGTAWRPLHLRTVGLLAGPQPDPRSVLAALGERAARDDAGVDDIAAALRDGLRVAAVELRLAGTGAGARVGRAAPYTADIPFDGDPGGTITVAVDDPEEWHELRPVLERTRGLIATAVQLAAVNDEVRAVRARTVEVRQEERRMLHAELHDSLAPSLAGIGFGLSAADTLIADGGDWRESVRSLREGTATCTADVRRLARALLPTALDQGDLEAALTELTEPAAVRGRVAVSARGTDGLDADLQVRVYLLVAAAVQEFRAGAEPIRVTVTAGPDAAAVRIETDAELTAFERLGRRADELGATPSAPGDSPWVARFPR